MKNIFLVSSAICTVIMILIVKMGMNRLNEANEEQMAEVKEWADDAVDQFDEQMTAEEEAEAARARYSERMKELSRLQEAITLELTEAAASQAGQANTARPGTTANPFARRQSEINNAFQRLYEDLARHLQGPADERHIQALESIRDSRIINDLRDIKAKMLQHAYGSAVESSRTCALKMAKWGTQLENE